MIGVLLSMLSAIDTVIIDSIVDQSEGQTAYWPEWGKMLFCCWSSPRPTRINMKSWPRRLRPTCDWFLVVVVCLLVWLLLFVCLFVVAVGIKRKNDSSRFALRANVKLQLVRMRGEQGRAVAAVAVVAVVAVAVCCCCCCYCC